MLLVEHSCFYPHNLESKSGATFGLSFRTQVPQLLPLLGFFPSLGGNFVNFV